MGIEHLTWSPYPHTQASHAHTHTHTVSQMFMYTEHKRSGRCKEQNFPVPAPTEGCSHRRQGWYPFVLHVHKQHALCDGGGVHMERRRGRVEVGATVKGRCLFPQHPNAIIPERCAHREHTHTHLYSITSRTHICTQISTPSGGADKRGMDVLESLPPPLALFVQGAAQDWKPIRRNPLHLRRSAHGRFSLKQWPQCECRHC